MKLPRPWSAAAKSMEAQTSLTRAKKAGQRWEWMHLGIANAPPTPDFIGMPRLTVRMAARIQSSRPTGNSAAKNSG